MKVYQTKKGYFAGWHTSVNKAGILEHFDSGTGTHRKTKVFSFVCELDYAESWYDVTEIAKKYGYEIAVESADFLTAGIIVKEYTKAYINLREKMESVGIPQDDIKRAFKAAKLDYWLALCGIGSFDIVAIDDFLKVPEGISTYDYIVANFDKNLADAIMAGI